MLELCAYAVAIPPACWMTTMRPYPLIDPAYATVPAAEATIGVPAGAAMSIPACSRPQRCPKGDTSVPLTGQAKPDEVDGGGAPGVSPPPED
jgi:hypothetical protein